MPMRANTTSMSFIDYLRTVQTLTEGGKGGAGYLSMFNDFIADDDDAKTKQTIERYITWARKNLQKNDRIVWFLRWVRVELANRMKHTDTAIEIQRLGKRLGASFAQYDLVTINTLMTNLVHYLSMPIPQIQTIVWQKQSPRELLEQMDDVETDWKEANADKNNLLNYAEGQEPAVIMSFPDGYKWFNLQRSSCSAEAKAMGHCGNASGRGTILSLRRLAKTNEGQTYWYPVLTFILHSDGYLGEMKGRNNDKPIEKYHPYIIALLKNYDEIEGIRGGGYLPEHNFSMSDLEPDVAAELKKLKSGLADLDDIYKAEGMTPRLIKLINNRLPSGLSVGNYDKDRKSFIVESWENLDSFLRYGVYDDSVEKILEIAEGNASFQSDRSSIENAPTVFRETVLDMPLQWQERLIKRAGLSKAPSDSMDHVLMNAAVQLERTNDAWYTTFLEVYASEDRIKEEAWERLARYVESGWSFACQNVFLNIPDDVESLKTFVENNDAVELRIGEADIIRYAMAGSEDDGDDVAWEIGQMQGDGSEASWETVDTDNTAERRHEHGLLDSNHRRRDGDPWLAGIDTTTKSLTDDFLAVLQGNQPGGKIHDERQRELNLEGVNLRRLMQLAGRSGLSLLG